MFDIKSGRSGCKLELLKNGVVRKTSSHKFYNKRLLKQYNKQKSFCSEFFATPQVFQYNSTEELNNFTMEYVYGKSFGEYCIEEVSLDFPDRLLSFLQNSFQNSYETDVNPEIFTKKTKELKNIIQAFQLDMYTDFLMDFPITKIPIGYCHGDLTFSNMIFSNKIFLIDFLDNNFSSPLYDLVKLRQDTNHKFYFLFNRIKKTKKIEILLNYIDSKLNEAFDLLDNNFLYLSILNLVRLLPYLKSQKEVEFALAELKTYEHYIANCG